MVNYCVICKKSTNRGSGRSIHRMPRHNARRKLWMDQLNLGKKNSTREVYVCSDHFCDEDFLYKLGKRFLKTEAIPSRISLSLHRSSRTSPDERSVTQELSDNNNIINLGSVGELSDTKLCRTSTATDSSPTLSASDLSVTLTASESSSTLTASESSGTWTASESSGTSTASESSNKLVSSKVFTVPHPTISEAESPVRRARKRKCFVGDVTDEDFRTPKQGKFVFSLAKQKIAEQNKALNALRTKNRRLQQKLNSLRVLNWLNKMSMNSTSNQR